jgi:hypothetical protein
MNTVKMLKTEGQRKKGKLYNVTSRHAQVLVESKTAVIVEKKENKEADKRETK